MSDMPSDVYRLILLRVPVDSLFRCRLVCKDWCRIIDDHLFVEEMHRLHRGPPVGSEFLKLYSLPLLASFDAADISTGNKHTMMIKAVHIRNNLSGRGVPRLREMPVASCDGLILMPAWHKSMVWVIWNPFTGESLELPLCDDFLNTKGRRMPCSGLGYDAVNKDYKAVRIAPCPSDHRDNYGRAGVKFVTFIYSMNSNTWHKIPDDLPRSFIRDIKRTGVFWNGSLYWAATKLRQPVGYAVNCVIALDLTTETFRILPFPSVGHYQVDYFVQLDVLGGHLFLSFNDVDMDSFNLWMAMDSDSGEMWTQIMWLEREYYIQTGNVKPVAYLKDKGLVLLQVANNKFWCCDVKNKCRGSVKIFGLPDTFSSQVFPASLVRLKGRYPANDDDDEGIGSEARTLKRKRNRMDDDRLKLNINFPFSLRYKYDYFDPSVTEVRVKGWNSSIQE